jgi:hypothetical protein
MVRLNLIDWAAGAIAPDALLRFWKRHAETNMKVYYSARAHVKAYVGDTGFLVGSANLTMRGLAGTTDELLWYESGPAATAAMWRILAEYRRSLEPLTLPELEDYIGRNEGKVRALRKKTPKSPERALPKELHRPRRLGYKRFVAWLGTLRSESAATIKARAEGEGNLSGHIRSNFYGIRQFFIEYPSVVSKLGSKDPTDYRLRSDDDTLVAFGRFVTRRAVDEDDFRADSWRNYLPVYAGGRQESGGATIGNLNRMLPLMARYLR